MGRASDLDVRLRDGSCVGFLCSISCLCESSSQSDSSSLTSHHNATAAFKASLLIVNSGERAGNLPFICAHRTCVLHLEIIGPKHPRHLIVPLKQALSQNLKRFPVLAPEACDHILDGAESFRPNPRLGCEKT